MTLQYLIDLGFTPLNAVLIITIIVLWHKHNRAERANYQNRIMWHKETRSKLAEAMRGLRDSRKRHDACDKDRLRLKAGMILMQRQINTLKSCPHTTCPLRPVLESLGPEEHF